MGRNFKAVEYEAMRPTIAKLYRRGWSAAHIGKELGMCRKTVQKHLHAAKVRLKPQGWMGVDKCLECGRVIQYGKRCQPPRYCARLRQTELWSEYYAENREKHKQQVMRLQRKKKLTIAKIQGRSTGTTTTAQSGTQASRDAPHVVGFRPHNSSGTLTNPTTKQQTDTQALNKNEGRREKFRAIGAAISARKSFFEHNEGERSDLLSFDMRPRKVNDPALSSRLCGPAMKTVQFESTLPEKERN